MSPEYAAQLAAIGSILLYVFKTSVVLCSVDKKPLRVLAAGCFAFALLWSAKNVFSGVQNSLSISTAGIVAISAVFLLAEAFKPRRSFLEIWQAFLAFGLQQPAREPKSKTEGPNKGKKDNTSPSLPTFMKQLRHTLDTFVLASIQYICYDAVILWVSRYPYSTLIQQSTSFRMFHSAMMGILLYLMFQVVVVPLLAIAFLIYPPWAPTGVKAFHRPWLTTSPQDFWSNRWHQFFRSSVLLGAVLPSKHLITALRLRLKAAGLPPNSPLTHVLNFLERSAPFFCAFVLSGLIHEYMNWASMGMLTGHQLAFFVIHGVLVVLEGVMKLKGPRPEGARAPKILKMVGMYCLLVVTASVFFEPWLRADMHLHFYRPVLVAQPLLNMLGVTH